MTDIWLCLIGVVAGFVLTLTVTSSFTIFLIAAVCISWAFGFYPFTVGVIIGVLFSFAFNHIEGLLK